MKTITKLIYLILIFTLVQQPMYCLAQRQAVKRDNAHLLIDTALSYAKANSIYRNVINWKHLEDTVRSTMGNAKSIQDAVPAVKLLYKLLGDHHGFLIYKNKYYGWRGAKVSIDTPAHQALLNKIKAHNTTIKSQLLEKGYGYLLIPDNNPTHPNDQDLIGQQIQDSLNKLNPEKLKGLVIDLRLNPGGGMFAMLGGIANLFSPGKLGSFIDPISKTEQAWGVTNNTAYVGSDTYCRLTHVGKALASLKVVVLIGPQTASSGEAVAISFKGRNNTWFIGEDTGGYTTANDSFQLSDDIGIFMATSVEADTKGHIYWNNVTPDEQIIGGDNFDDRRADKKITAALKWLKNK
ncbi:S41 family peptidase [Mucilaginibacter polytrichastri]|uniref:Tail specific protease domain-containing protein n=1 Tax=Mucilaginibacter polytrichastri TaxID=1302689 RepID=A0A1Q5ZYP6_9SPHI|nr:S41 family peptidase [Mucilaginibacter polytrichastri]OKS86869.1 hypothetical protein RG47T_2327 [Mucilaginibacter polytrichastri]SFT17597.1 Peptidase family S41 [Mucilaginibacter polytrichastri]